MQKRVFGQFFPYTACNVAHVIAKAFIFVCLSVRLSNACIPIKRKKLVPTFLYQMKDRLS